MSRFERDHTRQIDSTGDAPHHAPEPFDPNSDAETSAAHIAALVRRTTERQAAPGPSSVVRPDATAVPQASAPSPTVTQRIAEPVAEPIAEPAAVPVGPPVGPPVPHRHGQPVRGAMWPPSRRIVVAGAAVAVMLIGGGFALSATRGSETRPPRTAPLTTTAPAGYSLKVKDVITDCAANSRGRTKSSFEAQNCVKATRLLAVGRVGGRKVLFVVSRIEMESADTAAVIKQVLDGSGTGNLNDLIRDGRTFRGAPDKMPSSGYASVQTGRVVTVSEAGFIDGGRSSSTDASLRAAASEVAGMVSAQN